jgi:hypothetical protein
VRRTGADPTAYVDGFHAALIVAAAFAAVCATATAAPLLGVRQRVPAVAVEVA